MYILGTDEISYKPMQFNLKFVKNYVIDYMGSKFYKMLMNHLPAPIEIYHTYRVSICGIFKDEADYLREWIEFHRIVGIDHFYLYNNNSTDEYYKILSGYIEDGIVTLISWPKNQDQMGVYRDCITRFRSETEWLGFIDIDEFVVPTEAATVYDVLCRFKNRAAVLVYWKFFNSGGVLKRPAGTLVTESFVVASPKLVNTGKVFYNTRFEFDFENPKNNMLHHIMWCRWEKYSLPTVNIFDEVCFFFEGIAFSHKSCPMQINHYFSKSYGEYKKKMNKTDVYHKTNPHTLKYLLNAEIGCTGSDYTIFRYLLALKLRLEQKRQGSIDVV